MSMVQVSALEDLWKATPDAKVEDLDAAEVGIGGCTALTISQDFGRTDVGVPLLRGQPCSAQQWAPA